MHCPICKQSFGKGVKRCPLHGSRLVEGDFMFLGEPAPPSDDLGFGEDPTIHGDQEPTDRLLGRTFKDRFIVDEQIGEGAMGIVYRGRDLSKSPPEWVAIKVLKAQESDELGLEQRFKREAVLVSKLNHPNTIRFVDWGAERDGTLYLVTELLKGKPLDKLLEEHRLGLGEERALDVIDQIAASLEDAHGKGVVHRDIKPANVFVDGNRAKLLDFGIARIAFNGMELSKTFAAKTATGMAMFTPMYCSPEQAVGDELDHRSDIYSLGVVGYHCLAGTTPFKGGLAGLIESHLSREPPPMAERSPGIAKINYATEALIRKMMAKRPEDRPQHASEVRAAIAEIRGDGKPTRLDLPSPSLIVAAAAAAKRAEATSPKEPVLQPAPAHEGIPRWVPAAIAVALVLLGYLVIRTFLASPT